MDLELDEVDDTIVHIIGQVPIPSYGGECRLRECVGSANTVLAASNEKLASQPP